MSTRCYAGIKNTDGTVEVTYSHFDGYPEVTGMNLLEGFNSVEQMKKLLTLGGVLSIEKTFEETKRSAYNDEELVLKFANVQDLNKHLKDEFIEYVYLFDEEKNKFIFKHVDDARFKTLKKIQRVSNIS